MIIGPDLLRRLGLVGALSVVMIMVTSPVASAVDHPLQLSLDQKRWSNTVLSPLVPSRTWVPGDTTSVTVWTRNATADPARLSVDLLREGGVPVTVSDLVVTATVVDRTATLDQSSSVSVPVSGGSVTPVTVTVTLPSSAGNATQDRQTAFDLRLTLEASTTGAAGPPTSPSTNPPGETTSTGDDAPVGVGGQPAGVEPASQTLPSTGGPPATVLLAALLLLAGGIALLRRRQISPTQTSPARPAPSRLTPAQSSPSKENPR